MKLILIIILFVITNFHGYSQNINIEGKWFVEDKETKSDIDVPEKITLVKDSIIFNSKSMVDSMYCTEYFNFEIDSMFYCTGECHAYDPKNNWFNYYGSFGTWTQLNRSNLQLDYVHGYNVTHCKFKIKRQRNKLILIKIDMKTVEINEEYQKKLKN